jgi:hypothetical protein
VEVFVSTGFSDTRISYTTDDVSFTDTPLLGEKTWTKSVALDPSNTDGAVVFNVTAKPASGENLGGLECSLYVEGRLFDRDYARVPVENHDSPSVSCGSTMQAILALKPIQH